MAAFAPEALGTGRGMSERLAVALAAARLRARRQGGRFSQYVDDPVGFILDVCKPLGLTQKQRQVAEAVRDHRRVAVPSAHDQGKSFIAANIIAWWLSVHEPGDAFAVSSAPTFKQVEAVLWRELNRAHRKAGLPGRMNLTDWYIDNELVAFGRKPADYDTDAFQGIHAKHVLVVLDEANGIPPSLWTGAETITTNEGSRILAIGNPDNPLSEFKRVCEPDSGWHVIHIDGLESPNFTDEDVPDDLRPLLLSRKWVEDMRVRWGEGSALWESKVRGRFPSVPAGQVYKELGPQLEWIGPMPRFKAIVGGLDFGGANEKAHKTAAVVAGIVDRDQPGIGENALVRFAHFEDAGPTVHQDLISWMRGIEATYGRRVRWRADKSQSFGISLAESMGFIVSPSHGGADSVWAGIGMQRDGFRTGRSRYTSALTERPSAGSESWYESMRKYRWQDQPDENKRVPGVPIKRDDDTPDADRYMVEEAEGFPTVVVTRTTRDTRGRPLATSAV